MDLGRKGKIEDTLEYYLKDSFFEDGNIIGYFEEYDTFTTIMASLKENGFSYSVRDSDMRKSSKLGVNCKEKADCNQNTIFFQLKAMSIKFFGLPFIVEKTTHFQCAYGAKYYKSRSKANFDSGSLPMKKRRSVPSKKMGCLARMTLKKIIVYPDYSLDVETDWRKKKKTIECLRQDLRDASTTVETRYRYYLSATVQSSHNHPAMHPDMQLQEKSARGRCYRTPTFKSSAAKPETATPDDNFADEPSVVKAEVVSPQMAGKWATIVEEKALSLQDANFLSTFVKFPDTVTFAPSEAMKPVINLQINGLIDQEEPRVFQIQTIEYHPPLVDLQALFKEKLKRLYTACEGCCDSGLLIKHISDLESIENSIAANSSFDAMVT